MESPTPETAKIQPESAQAWVGSVRGIPRRMFLKLAGGGTLALFGPHWNLRAAAPQDEDPDLAAYREHLRVTKGIMDIRTFHQSGTGPNYVNVVVVSAGFTAEQMAEFHAVCEKFTKSLFSVQPWNRYQGMVNIHAVFVADENPEVTRLKTRGHQKNEVLGCDNAMAVEYANYAAPAAGTVVFHNSSTSRGGAGIWGVTVCNKNSANRPMVPVHELGHGMAGLGDEYIQRQEPFKDAPETLQDTVNVTAEPNPNLSKWHYWARNEWTGLFGNQQRPKDVKLANFEGAGWIKGIYRPENACIMRCNRDAFCVVCHETMEANLFRYIDLFKVAEPAKDELVLWKGESLDFRLAGIDLLRQPAEGLKSRLNLYLDGKSIANSENAELAYQLRNATPGIHQLGACLNVQSDTVRQDFGFLSANRGWRVNVLSYRKPKLVLKPVVTIAADGALNVPVLIQHERPRMFQLSMEHEPDGAVLENGRFKWKPTGACGSWRVDFTVSLGKQPAVTASMIIHVKPAAAGDAAMEVQPLEPLDAVTGTPARFKLKATAGDADHLLYQPVQVPEGVETNRETGEICWIPMLGQAGPQRLRFRIHNGPVVARELDVVVRVRRAAMPAPVSYCNTYIPKTLKAIQQLQKNPVLYRRAFETLRLLRDRYSRVYLPALAAAKTMMDELTPGLRANCIQDLHLHAWAFTNKPDILKWMRELARSSKSEIAATLGQRLDQIDDYNTQRIAVASK